MNRIELYIDNNDRLTLDIFKEVKDEGYVRRVKGKDCYPYIKKLCETPIISARKKNGDEELLLQFSRHIINVTDSDEVLKRRGTAILRNRLANYLTKENRKKVKPKKVVRVNKHTGSKIIAVGLTLLVLSGVAYRVYGSTKETIDGKDVEMSIIIDNLELLKKDKESPPSQPVLYESIIRELNISIDYNDRSNDSKAIKTKSLYGDILTKYAKRYGIDPKVLIAIATQERGIHSESIDEGGGIGLMQIQRGVWAGKTVSVYNYETGQQEIITIDKTKLGELEYNIFASCIAFQHSKKYMKNNILASIQCYNFGYGNMNDVLNKYSALTGKTKEQILSDQTDIGWLDCRDAVPAKEGDHEYVEHILSYLGPEIDFDNISNNGEIVNLHITNSDEIKNMSIH